MHQDTQSPFSGLYAPIPDTAAYLKRIGYTGTPAVSLDCLAALMTCHLAAVPFENLDVFHGHLEPALDTAALFRKIVQEGRGGYCFEINGLFQRLLSALGFSCWSATARIALGHDYRTPPAHQVILVELEGRRYFCDVGYGGPVPASPVEVTYDKVVTCSAGRRYRFAQEGRRSSSSWSGAGHSSPCWPFPRLPVILWTLSP